MSANKQTTLTALTNIHDFSSFCSFFFLQVIFSTTYSTIIFLLTDQPFEFNRYARFTFAYILTTIIADAMGLLLGAIANPIVSKKQNSPSFVRIHVIQTLFVLPFVSFISIEWNIFCGHHYRIQISILWFLSTLGTHSVCNASICLFVDTQLQSWSARIVCLRSRSQRYDLSRGHSLLPLQVNIFIFNFQTLKFGFEIVIIHFETILFSFICSSNRNPKMILRELGMKANNYDLDVSMLCLHVFLFKLFAYIMLERRLKCT